MSGAHRARSRHGARRTVAIVTAVAVALATIAAGTLTALAKTVTITVDGASREVTTLSHTVAGALASAGVAVGEHDTLAPGPAAAIGDGSTIVVDHGKRVTIAIDGIGRELWTTAPTVGDVLTAAAISVGPHDTLAPSLGTRIADGSTVVLQRGRELTLTVDGSARTFWTTAATVGQALVELGRGAGDLELSADRSREIPLSGLSISAATLHTVALVDGVARARSLATSARTVAEVLRANGIVLDAMDTVIPAGTAAITDGMTIVIQRRDTTTLVHTVAIPQPDDVTVDDPDLTVGTTTVDPGHPGLVLIRSSALLVNGKVNGTKEIGRITLSPAAATTTHVGTRPLLDWRGDRVFFHDYSYGVNWDGLATCESTNRPTAVNANPSAGYPTYGLFQFDLPTWRSVGGSGNPVDASPQEQLLRAKLLYQQRGLSPWACAYAAH